MQHTIGISDMKITENPDDVLITYALGSCVGLTLYDRNLNIGGMVHCMLPLSKTDLRKAEEQPCMFTDTGVTMLLHSMLDCGCQLRDLVARLAGASRIMDSGGLFRIGERNYTVARKMLWKNKVLISSEDVGGTSARTMSLYMKDGRTTIRSNGAESILV